MTQDDRHDWFGDLAETYVCYLAAREGLEVFGAGKWTADVAIHDKDTRQLFRVEVRATDPAGNTDLNPAHRTWNIDTSAVDATPPTATLIAPADGVWARGTVTLSADATDNLAVDHVDFLVDGTLVATVGTAPYSVAWDSTSVADGPVSIAARAVDTSSNSATSAGHTVAVDNNPPQTTISAGPNPLVNDAAATFSFSSNEAGTTFRCGLDGGALAGCTSPAGLSGLGDLTVTCYSRLSRNRMFGEQLGRGRKPEEIVTSSVAVAEGYPTARSAYQLAHKLKISTPIIDEVYAILYDGKNVARALQDLVRRETKAED